jgi:hypothetical protein
MGQNATQRLCKVKLTIFIITFIFATCWYHLRYLQKNDLEGF